MLKGAVSVAIVAVTVACTDGIGTGFDDGTGKIALTTEVDAAVVSGRSRAEHTEVMPENLTIRVTSENGNVAGEWLLDEFPTDKKFNIGTYTVEAFYGDENTEGFSQAAFYGSQKILVQENEVTPVHVTAKLTNALVSVTYTDEFIDYMTDYSAEVHAAGGSYITYTTDETRPAYVKPGQTEVFVEFTKPNGKGGKLSVADFETVAAHHYHINIGLGDDGAGKVLLEITFNEELTEDARTIDIGDEVLNAPAPTVSASGFTTDEVIDFVPGQQPDNSLTYNIIAHGGLQQITLTTQSESLISDGWPAEVNLIGADQTTQETLRNLGLKALGVFNNPDKMAVVDLTGVLAHIRHLNSGDNISAFTLVTRDIFGKVSEPVTLKVRAQETKMHITEAHLFQGSDLLTVNLEFNAGDPEKLVKFSYVNNRGTKSDLAISKVEKIGDDLYRITGHATEANPSMSLQLTATAEGIGSETVTIDREATVDAGTEALNVFANTAYIPVTVNVQGATPAEAANFINAVPVLVSTDGVNFKRATAKASSDNKYLVVTGLEPGTAYSYKLQNSTAADAVLPGGDFTTEAAAQVTNGSFDADVTIAASESHWENVVFEGWGTNNALTTSQGGNYGYTRISGTKQTDDSHSGKAVSIRTQGWGKGNSATGTCEGEGIFGPKLKYIDAGLLHLGSTRSVRPEGFGDLAGSLETTDLDCGIEFASRPASVSFWYKYTAKNAADHGQALVQVIDASGNILTSCVRDLSATAEYTEVTMPLSYATATKAAKLYIRFLSTVVPEALTKSNAWMTAPKFAATGREEYAGSTLYIDDVKCNY